MCLQRMFYAYDKRSNEMSHYGKKGARNRNYGRVVVIPVPVDYFGGFIFQLIRKRDGAVGVNVEIT